MDPQYYPIEQQEDGSFSIFYTGTAPTPVIIKIVPRFNLGDNPLIIAGLTNEPIVINEFNRLINNAYMEIEEEIIEGAPGQMLQANDILIIDGEHHLFTLNDNSIISQVQSPGFPYLQPGENKIRINPASDLGIEIRYKVRYI